MRSCTASIAASLLASVLGALVSWPGGAAAFERSTVEGTETPLYWRYRTIRIRTAIDSSDDLAPLQVEDAVARSILSWNGVSETCSDLWLVEGGPPVSRATSLTFGDPDMENRIVWRETEWPAAVSPDTLAVTTVTFRRASGQILDADIDLNGVHHMWTDTDDATLARTDAQNTLTHELGHLIGLAHAPDPGATMFVSSEPGDLEKRSLSPDDADGLCFVYPEGLISPGAPLHSGDALTTCAVSPAQTSRRPLPWLALPFGAALLLWRRSRSARP